MSIYRKILALLTLRERLRFAMVGGVALLMGLVEAAGVASILPFLAVLANPDVVVENDRLRWLYERSGAADVQGFLMLLGTGVFLFILVTQVVKLAGTYAVTRFAQRRSYALSTRLMMRYLGQPYAWHLGRNSVDLRKTLLQEVSQAVTNAVTPAMQAVVQVVVIAFLVALMVIIDPMVALVTALVVGGCYAGLTLATRRFMARIGRERVRTNKRRFRIASDTMGGVKEIKLLHLERVFWERFRAQSDRFNTVIIQQKMLSEAPRFLLEALLFGGMVALVLFMMAREGGDFNAILPTLGLYAVAVARLFPAMQNLYRQLNTMRFGGALLDLVAGEFAATADAEIAPRAAAEPLPLRQAIELDRVVYAYPGAAAPVLNGLSLRIEANSVIGVVGGTGAGKTTTIDLILGLLQPQGGALRVDGAALTPQTTRRWQRSLGYVPQQIFLLDDSVTANIAFGVPKAEVDHAAVERAARAAEMHEFIMGLPDGYATSTGEAGKRLSGGQRQRLGIARALYHDPDVLILDEATSALDTVTERQVMTAIDGLRRRKTIIMIAHRLSTVRGCDTIFFLENGALRAQGPYDALVERDAAFRKLAHAAA